MKDKKDQNKNISISVKNVSKTFSIPHESINTLKGAFVNIFRKNTYEKFNALDDVSFEVKKGEFFGILGRNGSGKSTLLKILAGVYVADKGDIKIEGLISPFLELGIGFNPELSGRDNIYLNATVLGLTEKEIDEKFDSIVAFSELERFIDQKIKNYSSGMQVRLAFSVAIHANREILLMDEVLAVGDANFQAKCLEEFSRYKEMGKTVILVTHDIGTVQRYCDRAMLLRNGKIEKIGSAEEVGNEYIYQNMSDEEKRMYYEEKLMQETETITGVEQKEEKIKFVKIRSVSFCSADGEEKKVFKTNDSLVVNVELDVIRNPNEFNYSISLYDKSDTYIIGVNNIFDKFDSLGSLKNKRFGVLFENIPLNNGIYMIKVLLAGSSFSKLYDFFVVQNAFRIISDNKVEGLVNVNHKWL